MEFKYDIKIEDDIEPIINSSTKINKNISVKDIYDIHDAYLDNQDSVDCIHSQIKIDNSEKNNINNDEYYFFKQNMLKELADKFIEEIKKEKEKGFTPEVEMDILEWKESIDNLLKDPLAVEVEEMLERGASGLPPKILYVSKKNGGKWKNPFEFLEDIYGKYLKYFTPSLSKDYIFMHHLKLIDSNFYERLRSYLAKNKLLFSVPTKEDCVTKSIAECTEKEMKIYHKVQKLQMAERRRKERAT